MCDLKCEFFTTPRVECQRDPCLAFGSSCRGYTTSSNTTTFAAQSSPSCLDWCCQANEPKMTTTIVACGIGFIVLLGITFYAFRRYTAWKKLRDDEVAEREYNPCNHRPQQTVVYHDSGAGPQQRNNSVSANGAGRMGACKAFLSYCRTGKSSSGGSAGSRAMIVPPPESKPSTSEECGVPGVCPPGAPASTAQHLCHPSEAAV